MPDTRHVSVTLEHYTDLVDTISELVANGCTAHDGCLDSMAMRSYQDAIRLLAEAGRVEIIYEVGRRTIARWKNNADQA